MGLIPVKGFFRPSGAPCRTRLFPWLAPWATFSRPSGADAHESYQQNVETPGTGESACPTKVGQTLSSVNSLCDAYCPGGCWGAGSRCEPRPRAIRESESILPLDSRFCSAWNFVKASEEV